MKHVFFDPIVNISLLFYISTSVLLFLTYPDAVQKVRLEISENHRVLLRSTQSVFCYIFFFTDLKNRVSILLGLSQTFQKPFCNCNA